MLYTVELIVKMYIHVYSTVYVVKLKYVGILRADS